jgi:glycosyltransferase involved in cell wall biosynthesis
MIGLAHGRPVLASDLPCFAELAAESAGVDLFPAGDAGLLGARLQALLEDAAARQRLGDAARAFAARRTWRAVAERTLEVYRSVLAEPAAQGIERGTPNLP